MKYNYTYILFLFSLLIFNTVIGQNLVSNGNFETGDLTGWSGFNNQNIADNITNSRVGNLNNGEGSLYQVIDVIPGSTYEVHFNYLWVSGNGNYNLTVRVKDEDAQGRPNLNLIGGTSADGFKLNTAPDQWNTDATFSFVAPSGVSRVRLLFYKTNGNRPTRIDNVQLIDSNYSPPSLVDSNTPSNAQPDGVEGDWKLDFSDEFNDSSLNLSKWYKSVSSKSRAPRANLGVDDWWWVEDNAFLNGSGELVLRGSKVDNNTMYCGSIESRNLYEVQYGYLEARIKIAVTAKGNHTAFWLQGHNQSNVDNSAADGAEVDIFESAWVTNTSKAVVHYDGYGADKKNHTIPFNTPDIHTGFHTYGLLWTENEMYIYYDGQRLTSTNASKPFPFSTNPTNGHPLVPNVPEWLWLSVGASFGDGDFQSQPVGILSDALVDYVRVYKPNISTLGKVKFEKTDFEMYPNPSKGRLRIKTSLNKHEINIYDHLGKRVFNSYFSDTTYEIDLSAFTSGIYHVRVTNEHQTHVKRLIVL